MVGAHYFRGPNLVDAILADYEIYAAFRFVLSTIPKGSLKQIIPIRGPDSGPYSCLTHHSTHGI
jgi:hypothetical protein